ncbi:hypothetical protein QQX98_008708 [Neonectria punicea]|uniref:Uncharacterized protein n=1 Tax=Neonectria punicea TaxID=979145 RepID=A0ABR1GUE8_9HYPO
MLVYPHSSGFISSEFHSRFREVVNIFRQNVEEHPRLREHVQHVDYALRMCGESPETSHPSILVFCRPSEFSSLRSLLTSKQLRFQPLSDLVSTDSLDDALDESLGEGLDDVLDDALDVDDSEDWENEVEATTNQEAMERLYTYSVDDSSEDDGYVMDDVVYDSFTDEDTDDKDETSDVFEPSAASISTIGDDDGYEGAFKGQTEEVNELFALFPSQKELASRDELDLDWAVIKLVDPEHWRPNAFVDPRKSSDPIFLSTIVSGCPNEETSVLILTRDQLPKRGMLQRGASVLGGINGNRATNAWTVVLSGKDSLKKGDSGSIVVDAQSYAPYGLVVALNPLGEVYISPLAAIIGQIRNHFRSPVVVLPDPTPTLSKLISLHIELRQSDIADELLGYHGQCIRNTNERSGKIAVEGWTTHEVLSAGISKMRCREKLRNVIKEKFKWQLDLLPQGEDALAEIMGRDTSFPIVWEHGVLPFLVEHLTRWCGRYHVISIIRGVTPGSRRIYIMTTGKLTHARRLIIAVHVRDLLPEQFVHTTGFCFSTGYVDRLTWPWDSDMKAIDTAKNPYYFADPRMGDSVGLAGSDNNTEHDGTSTLGPCLVINDMSFRLGNLHPFIKARQPPGNVRIQHPSRSDRSRCMSKGHDAIPHKAQCVLGTMAVDSGLDLRTTRTSKNPYWEYCHQVPPSVITDWVLMTSETCKANILRRLPSDAMPSHRELVVRNTNAVSPGATVVSTGRTSGHRCGQVCEIPAYVSAFANGTGRATREWFIEDSTPYGGEHTGIYGAYGDSGAVVVDAESHALVGQLWGHSLCFPSEPRLTFFTAINDVFDDIEEKFSRPELPQNLDPEEELLPFPSCRHCYDLDASVHSQRSPDDPLRSMMMMNTTRWGEELVIATPTGHSSKDADSLPTSKTASKRVPPTKESSSLKPKKQRLDQG